MEGISDRSFAIFIGCTYALDGRIEERLPSLYDLRINPGDLSYSIKLVQVTILSLSKEGSRAHKHLSKWLSFL